MIKENKFLGMQIYYSEVYASLVICYKGIFIYMLVPIFIFEFIENVPFNN